MATGHLLSLALPFTHVHMYLPTFLSSQWWIWLEQLHPQHSTSLFALSTRLPTDTTLPHRCFWRDGRTAGLSVLRGKSLSLPSVIGSGRCPGTWRYESLRDREALEGEGGGGGRGRGGGGGGGRGEFNSKPHLHIHVHEKDT